MLHFLTLLLLLSLLFLNECKSNVKCITVTGLNSNYGDNSLSFAKCSTGYTLTSCGIYGPWGNIDGSFISGDFCYARMGSGSIRGHYVQAKARCCTLQSSITCINHNSPRSGRNDGHSTIAHCSKDQILTGFIYIYNT